MLEEKILKIIKQYKLIESKDKVLVAVSGGPDSMCVLDILNTNKEKLKINIELVHIHHGLRKHADKDLQYVETYCKKHNIEMHVKKANVNEMAKEMKLGVEEAGRKIRYNFFEEVDKQYDFDKIVIAHNKNDVAETILMNLFRGSGKNGLKSMKMRRDKYIRPLIHIEKSDIEKYCEQKSLNPVIDETNSDNTYTRNKIRNELIPYIQKEFNPNIVDALSRLSEIIEDEDNYINNQVETIYQNVLIKVLENVKITIDAKIFNKQDIVIKRKLILMCISKLFGTTKGIEKIHIEDVVKLIENNVGNKYIMPNKRLKVGISKGIIDFIQIKD